MDIPRLRLAPTPSGLLHLGNGVNFAYNAALAAHLHGQLLLRIDDLDGARVRGQYLNDIDATIRWLLPEQAEALCREAMYQSRRLVAYNAALQLLRKHNMVYACRCSRREVRAAQQAAGLPEDINAYPGTCRDCEYSLDKQGVVWRMREGDTIVRQRNRMPSYQLASLVDDVDANITHIVRGEDLLESTLMQLQLAQVLAQVDQRFAQFQQLHFYHHPLLTDTTGAKLSKRAGASSLEALRHSHGTATPVFAKAGQLLNAPQTTSLAVLTAEIARLEAFRM